MTNIAEIQKDIFKKIDMLPLENLKEVENKIQRRFFSRSKQNRIATKTNLTTSRKQISFLIESIFGIKIDHEFLNYHFIENLFKNADFKFYENETKTHLFSQKTELLEHDFGKLKTISALDAFHRYDLDRLETAKEKMYVKVK